MTVNWILLAIVAVGALLFAGMPTLIRWRIAVLRAIGWDSFAAHLERHSKSWVLAGRLFIALVVGGTMIWSNL